MPRTVPRLAPVVGGLFASLAPGASRAETCAPTVVEIDASLPEPWRTELQRLGERTGRAGAPWACHGGQARLEPISGSAARRLVVVDAEGREKAQEVETAEDVVPFGQALLARPLTDTRADADATSGTTDPEGKVNEPAVPPSDVDGAGETNVADASTALVSAVPADTTEQSSDDRAERTSDDAFVFGASLGPRLVLPQDDLAIALRLHALGAIGAVVFGGWSRVEGPSWTLDDTSTEVSTFAVGPSLGARFALGGPQVRVAVEPALAVVIDRAGVGQPEVDARIGAGADVVLPISTHVRLTIGVNGEIAPARLDGGEGRGDRDGDGRGTNDPDMPGGGVGLRFGIEAAP